jgi:hypothetical protein
MTSDPIDEEFVRRAARGVGLELAPSHVPGVIRYLKTIAGMADSITGFPIDEGAEPAPVFTPCSAPARD